MKLKLNPFKMKLPAQLVIMIVLVSLFGSYIPLPIKQFSLATSLMMKEILVFVLPAIIFSYLASCLMSFKKGVFVFIIALFVTVFASNFLATQVAYFSSIFVIEKLTGLVSSGSTNSASDVLLPYFTFNLPSRIRNDYALFAGLAFGLFFTLFRTARAEQFVTAIKAASDFFLRKIFIPVVPIFILGFLIQLQHDGQLALILTRYAPVFLFTVFVEIGYVLVLLLILAGFNLQRTWTYIRNIFPSAIAGLSTASSAAAMPLTLQGAERNTSNPTLANAVVPATVNIHMIGNAITITIMALSMLIVYELPLPAYTAFAIFGIKFALAQLAVAAVPGGGLVVMYPFISSYLGLSDPAHQAAMFALYLLFDFALTCTNIIGNGAYAIGFNKVFSKYIKA